MSRTSSCGAFGETCSPWKWRFVMFMQGWPRHCSLDWAASSFLYSTFRMLPGCTRITGGVLLPRKRNSDLPVTGSDAATSVTGVLACGSSGSIRSCPLAAATNSPMLAIQPEVPSASFWKIFTRLFPQWFCSVNVDGLPSWLGFVFGPCSDISLGSCRLAIATATARTWGFVMPPPI